MDDGREAEDAKAATLVEAQVVGLGDEPDARHALLPREHLLDVLLEHRCVLCCVVFLRWGVCIMDRSHVGPVYSFFVNR